MERRPLAWEANPRDRFSALTETKPQGDQSLRGNSLIWHLRTLFANQLRESERPPSAFSSS